jgi:broad specificity phosphatase PhoE
MAAGVERNRGRGGEGTKARTVPLRCHASGSPEPSQVTPRWPSVLWAVRHGQSAGNVARDAATEAGLARIALEHRDVDVPLSALGRQQAQALGKWFAGGGEDGRPEIMLASPYVRAMETAKIFRDNGGCPADEKICCDERLREKEFGILDGLTGNGIRQFQPEQAEFRRVLGKFYHRPPGGESWVDVIFRLRSLMDTVSLHYGGRRVMIVAHQVVVLCLRYVIENLTEAEILAIDREGDIANCAITEYRFDPAAGKDGNLVLARYNVTAPMQADATEVTAEPDKMVAARG